MKSKHTGFTMVELMVVIAIMSIIFLTLTRFIAQGYPLSRTVYQQSLANEAARLQLKRVAKALREARISDTGAYPLVEMGQQKIIFYSDVDADETTERIRYELVGNEFVRGVTEPSGDPIAYHPETEEVVTTVASAIRNGADPIFTYYNGDYPADQSELTPVDLTEVKYIKFRLLIDIDPAADPEAIDVTSQVQLRNLKDNLGD